MTDRETAEIRRRFKSEKSGISRVRGCYVNEKREIISEMDQSLGLMTETEADEVLSLLKKTLSGQVGTTLLDIPFSTKQVTESPEYKLLADLRGCALKDDELVRSFFKKVIGHLTLEGNYMILLAYDSYDVFSYHKDGGRSEDSGEIFSYILCTVCPVKSAKPTLSYYIRESCFRNVTADSTVSSPVLGFMFPAFDNRATNIYGALYYTRSRDDNHEEFAEGIFGETRLPMPVEEQKETFRTVLASATDDACSLPVIRSVRAQLCQAIQDHKESKEPEPLLVDKHTIRDMLAFTGISEEKQAAFEEKFDASFGPNAEVSPRNILDVRKFEVKTEEVTIKVDPAHAGLVETRVIDGVPYILIRADNGAEVNGIKITVE